MITKTRTLCLLATALLLTACGNSKSKLTPQTAKSLAKSAYIYAFPAVEHNKAIWEITTGTKREWNTIWVEPRLFSAKDTTVVSPNNDTYYCPGILDLRYEPVILSVPRVKGKRDFLIQFLDIFTNCPDYVSKLATGEGPGTYMIARPDWKGEIPTGVNGIIKVPATVVLVLGRIQVYGAQDKEAEILARQFKITPLSTFTRTPAPEAEPIRWTAKPYNSKTGDAEGFFRMFNYMIQYQILNEADKVLMDKYAAIGLGAGKEFSKTAFSPEIWRAIEEGAAEAKARIEAKVDNIGKKINGWQYSPENAGRWGTDYLTSAAAAWKYIYVNIPEESIYIISGVDADGNKPDGSSGKYALTFKKGRIPEAEFFWSLTIYGHKGYFMPNELNRNTINSSSEVKYGKDGSLTIYIQKENPGKEKESNWLPAPNEEFYMILRMYGPTQEAITGKWQIPPILKVR